MFTIQLSFRIDGREVPLDSFAQAVLSGMLASIKDEIQRIPGRVPFLARQRTEQPTVSRRALGIDEAARLLSLSKATVRQYVARGRIGSVRVGRRALIPTESLDKVLLEGVPSLRR